MTEKERKALLTDMSAIVTKLGWIKEYVSRLEEVEIAAENADAEFSTQIARELETWTTKQANYEKYLIQISDRLCTGLITVTTDISHCSKTGICTYAYWISSDSGPIKRSGVFKTKINGSVTGEVACIANAIHFLAKSGLQATRIVINTGSLVGKHGIEKNVQTGNPVQVQAIQYIRELFARTGWVMDIRHVKAHSGTSQKRKYVNSWCDKTARELLRETRIRHLKNKAL